MVKLLLSFLIFLSSTGWADESSNHLSLADVKLSFVTQSKVSKDRVYLSDIATCQGESWLCDELLAFPLFNAPAPGQSKTVTTREVLSIIDSDWAKSKLEVSGSPHVQIVAESQLSLKEDIEAYVARKIAAVSDDVARESLRVSLESLSVGNLPALRPGVQSFEISELATKLRRQNHLPRSIQVRLKASTKESIYQVDVPVALQLSWEEKQVVTVKDFSRGDQVQGGDLEERWIVSAMSVKTKRVDPSTLIGKTVRIPIAAGSIVRTDQFDVQRIVDMGETVTAEIQKDGLLVTAKGKALQPGSLGQVISIEHAATKKRYSARIKERGRVEVIGL